MTFHFGDSTIAASAQVTGELMAAGKVVGEGASDMEYWAYVMPLPELSGLRVNPAPGVAVPPKPFVPTIPSRNAPLGKETDNEVEIDAPVPEPVAFTNPVIVTPDTS